MTTVDHVILTLALMNDDSFSRNQALFELKVGRHFFVNICFSPSD